MRLPPRSATTLRLLLIGALGATLDVTLSATLSATLGGWAPGGWLGVAHARRAQPPPPPTAATVDEAEAAPEEPAPDAEIPDLPQEPPPPTDADLAGQGPDQPTPGAATATTATSPADLLRARATMLRDIVVVQRKSFLRRHRVEFTPFVGTTINDTLIQHTAFGGELNYFISDILAVGVRGAYYLDNVTDEEFFVRYHFARVPSLNRYEWEATGNFSYIPIWGKLTLLNRPIFHWDLSLSGGIGVTRTEVIPRDFANEAFSNYSLTFPVSIAARLYLTRWLAVQVALRDSMMLDRVEQAGRTLPDAAEAKAKQSETQFINNVFATVGVSFFLPTGFSYTTPR